MKLRTVVTFTILQLGSSVSLPTSCLNTSPGDSTLTDSLTLLSAAAKSLQSCPTLCNPRDGSPPGSPIPGILQARTLEWIAISFSNAWKWKVKVKSFSPVRLLVTPWTAAYQSSVHGIFQARVLEWGAIALISLKKWWKDKAMELLNKIKPECGHGQGFLPIANFHE